MRAEFPMLSRTTVCRARARRVRCGRHGAAVAPTPMRTRTCYDGWPLVVARRCVDTLSAPAAARRTRARRCRRPRRAAAWLPRKPRPPGLAAERCSSRCAASRRAAARRAPSPRPRRTAISAARVAARRRTRRRPPRSRKEPRASEESPGDPSAVRASSMLEPWANVRRTARARPRAAAVAARARRRRGAISTTVKIVADPRWRRRRVGGARRSSSSHAAARHPAPSAPRASSMSLPPGAARVRRMPTCASRRAGERARTSSLSRDRVPPTPLVARSPWARRRPTRCSGAVALDGRGAWPEPARRRSTRRAARNTSSRV